LLHAHFHELLLFFQPLGLMAVSNVYHPKFVDIKYRTFPGSINTPWKPLLPNVKLSRTEQFLNLTGARIIAK
ncbi:MAG: hypothetical protein WA323_00600, partial [Candidatus Nitrosopolaris sp.]